MHTPDRNHDKHGIPEIGLETPRVQNDRPGNNGFPHETVRFGAFELDLAAGDLRKHDRPVRISPQPLKVLKVLVTRPGQLITREELHHEVWGGTTFVDFEHGLNFCVRRIRAVLGDEAEKPHFIETVPRRGYRFIAPVERVAPVSGGETITPQIAANSARMETIPVAQRTPSKPRLRRLAFAGAFSLALLLSAMVLLRTRRRDGPKVELFRQTEKTMVVPLLSLPGEERMPAFSPDGSRVAFVWHAPDTKKSGIYALVVGSQSLLRLTNNAADYSPTWSPDGRYIAFLRDSPGKFSVAVVAALGGPERIIHTGVTNQISQGFKQGSSLSFSPDGKALVFSELDPATRVDSIKLLSLEDFSSRFVTSPPSNVVDRFPVWSPDGYTLAYVRSSGPNYVDELYLVSVGTGKTNQLTFDHHRIFGPPTFTRDGREIVFSSNRAGLESLWRVAISGGSPEAIAGSGPGTLYPALSQQGRYLAYERNEDEENIWRLVLRDQTHSNSSAKVLIPAGNTDNFLPQFSPDGRKIAFQSNRSGYSEIWVCDADGSNLAQLTNAQSLTGSPRWSPDGRYIAFDSRPEQHSEIDVVEFPRGTPHRLVSFPDADSVVPSWSHDGRWLYFASNRGGKLLHIWKIAVHDGIADPGSTSQITTAVGYAAFESADGRLLFYADPPLPGIWIAPRHGKRETVMWRGPGPDQWSNWVVTEEGMYFLAPGHPGPTIEFLNFKTRQVSQIAYLERPSFYGFALAPDGKSLIYSQQDRNEREILIMSHFQ
jgi:Tol biopolymer transport system component/DNA-binding winged helix-turn-helix (wHTH) protein